jgi:hypothetical protein
VSSLPSFSEPSVDRGWTFSSLHYRRYADARAIAHPAEDELARRRAAMEAGALAAARSIARHTR